MYFYINLTYIIIGACINKIGKQMPKKVIINFYHFINRVNKL